MVENKAKMKSIILKIIDRLLRSAFYIVLVICVIALLAIILPMISCFSFCMPSTTLSKSEYREMAELAKQGNITAMNQIRDHHVYNRGVEIFKFYEFKIYEARYWLSDDEYSKLFEQAEQGNETAKNKISSYKYVLELKQNIDDFLENNITRIQNFLKSCSTDSFCNSSDIYERYKDKAKEIKEE